MNFMIICFFAPFFEGTRANIDKDQKVLEDLRAMGLELHPVELKTSVDPSSMLISLYVEGAAAFDDLTRLNLDDQLVAQHRNAWPNLFRAARFIPAVEYIQANRYRSILIEEMHALFQEYDVIVTPSFAGNQLQITNLTGHPAVSVPNGFDKKGRPTSFTLLGNLYDEGSILALARAYQQATDFEEKYPPLFAK